MRDPATVEEPQARCAVPCDERKFFESFYAASVRGPVVQDRMTIGAITDPEARFHYNAVENAIIRALLRRSPPARGTVIEAQRALQARADLRLLDVGTGTGHWIDFFRDVFLVRRAVGVEITTGMAGFLRRKYSEVPTVSIVCADVADPSFPEQAVGGPYDFISAIGVMFHIVDDARWRRAIANLAAVLKPGGVILVGGDFGARTRDVQFHRSDTFGSWREFQPGSAADGELRVNKRVRSLADWHRAASCAGLEIVDLVRADREPEFLTPENDLLVLGGANNIGCGHRAAQERTA